MLIRNKNSLILILVFSLFLSGIAQETEKKNMVKYNTFNFEVEVTLPGSPDMIYDAATGDISGWWDHTFSEKPVRFFIEAKPGGGFWEYFDKNGDNGVLHARVIFAQRGKMLRMDGPLGLSGKAIQMVHTYTFEKSAPDSTSFKVSVRAAGEMDDTIPGIVEKVWKHFIVGRFKSYIESGKHLPQ